MLTTWTFLQVHAFVCTGGSMWLYCIFGRGHIWLHVCVSLCVCIKRPLTAIGGGGGAAGVFALAAIQHSTFLCDIQYCDLRKPALQRSSLFLLRSFSLCWLSFSLLPPPQFSLFLSFPPSFSIVHSTLFLYLNLGNHLSPSSLTQPSVYFPSSSKSFLSMLPFFLKEVPLQGDFFQVDTLILLPSWKNHNTVLVTMYHSYIFFLY